MAVNRVNPIPDNEVKIKLGLATAFYLREPANKPLTGAAPLVTCEDEAQKLLEQFQDHIERKIGHLQHKR
ncbi:hypothetical protein [Acinetobacter sp. ANC 4633]|uniref:hypothetical protein n=1 Tax=Acinetobacter sp. ANC 4633 TaxID=2529845 RepID=UPI001BC88549|nr:hypothetical protein [Acinetobacter sp. ANC 4633]